MATNPIDKKLTWTAAALLLSIPIIHLLVSRFFDNNWGINQWQFLPYWLGPLWLLVIVIAGAVPTILSNLLSRNKLPALFASAAMVVVLAILMIFRFDSFACAAGNIRVAELAQRDYLLIRWFEYGSFLAAQLLYELLSLFLSKTNEAGVWAWRGLSFVSAAVAMIGIARIAKLLSRDTKRRAALFMIVFFGPQVLPLFGFVGYSAIVVCVTTWYAYFALRSLRDGSIISLLLTWIVLLAGIFFHISLIYLLPPTLFVTTRAFMKSRSGTIAGVLLAALSYLALLVLLYGNAVIHLEWLVEILTWKGKNPFPDYGLFTPRHLGDMIQLIVGYAPQVFMVVAMLIFLQKRSSHDGASLFAGIIAISGFTVVFVIDPSNGIPSDIPLMVAYLFGISLMLAISCARVWSSESGEASLRSPIVITMLVVGAFLGYAPVYLNISSTDAYLTRYYNQHKEYYSTACFAFRDAYFYDGNLDKANQWELSVRARSDYFLNITGISNLIEADDNDEALRTLAWVRSKYPYRTEPQQLTATAQLNLHRYARAKVHIDTCFMLQPYGRDHFRNLYIYYRDQQQYAEAVRTLNQALATFTGDLDFIVDLMISHYRMADYLVADSLCDVVQDKDPKQPYPYLIRGLIAEMGGSKNVAATNYNKFMELAPEEPEAEFVKKRLDSLQSNAGN